MAQINHDSFTQPTHDLRLWRYISFTKYVSMLNSRGLYFSRVDTLRNEDPYEGMNTLAYYRVRREALGAMAKDIANTRGAHSAEDTSNVIDQLIQDQDQMAQRMAKSCYVNCWHDSDDESAAMWKIYSEVGAGIALTTHYSKLASAVPDPAYIGIVTYADHSRAIVDPGNLLNSMMWKKKPFAYEREVRLLVWDTASDQWKTGADVALPGLEIQVDLQTFIEDIYVSPQSPR